MTNYPIPENHHHWWLTAWGNWRRLHAIPAASIAPEEIEYAIDDCEPIVRFAACGTRLALAFPGFFSRFGMRRCVPCCRRLGIPGGRGTPVNERDMKRREAADAVRETNRQEQT